MAHLKHLNRFNIAKMADSGGFSSLMKGGSTRPGVQGQQKLTNFCN